MCVKEKLAQIYDGLKSVNINKKVQLIACNNIEQLEKARPMIKRSEYVVVLTKNITKEYVRECLKCSNDICYINVDAKDIVERICNKVKNGKR